MSKLLEPWDPPVGHYRALSEQEQAGFRALEQSLYEGFQALVLARLVVRIESSGPNKITLVRYAQSADGLAALERGDVAEVVARRLAD
jgi:hypothetical protein